MKTDISRSDPNMPALYYELEFAVKHLPPSIPEEDMKQIWDLFNALKEGGQNDAKAAEAMIDIGKIEWPHRKAYEAMMMACCSKTQQQMLLESLSDKTRKKFVDIGGKDATVQEIVHSRAFEEKLTPEERYEVQEAALTARMKMAEFMKGQIAARPKEYAERLQVALKEQAQIDEAISKLENLAGIDEDWREEILGQVEQMRLGWSIAEPDVSLGDANKAVEYWQGTLSVGESGHE